MNAEHDYEKGANALDDLDMFRDESNADEAYESEDDYIDEVDADGSDDGAWDAADDEFEDDVDEPAATSRRSSRRGRSSRDRQRSGGAGKSSGIAGPIGYFAIVAGIAVGVLVAVQPPALANVGSVFDDLGIQPLVLLLGGGILVAIARSRRLTASAIDAVQDTAAAVQDEFAALHESMTTLRPKDDQGNELGDADRMFMALQRQDEKLNNLTRATKMYGKPLVEITNQVADLQHLLAKLAEEDEREEESSQPWAERLDEAVGIARETRKSVRSIHDELSKQLESLGSSITESVAATANAGAMSNDLDDMLQSIRRELGAVATSITRLKSAPSAAPATPTARAASDASADAAAAGSGDDGGRAEAAAAAGGLAQSIAGKRSAPSKNVLGAIAKLRNMRQ